MTDNVVIVDDHLAPFVLKGSLFVLERVFPSRKPRHILQPLTTPNQPAKFPVPNVHHLWQTLTPAGEPTVESSTYH